jgi:non-ribosomal peptide synthetase component F
LLENLKASCRFDEPIDREIRPIRLASAYKAAESYCLREFGDSAPVSSLEALGDDGTGQEDVEATLQCPIDPVLFDRLRGIGKAGLGHVILGAYGALLSRLNGREEAVVLSASVEAGNVNVAPLKLSISWDLTFRRFVEQIEQRIDEALSHNHYSLAILTNPWRLAQHGVLPPILDVGYWYGHPQETLERTIQESEAIRPHIKQGISLALQVSERNSDVSVAFSYRKQRFSPDTIERLGSYLESILKEVANNPDIALGDIPIGAESIGANQAAAIDAAEEFNF